MKINFDIGKRTFKLILNKHLFSCIFLKRPEAEVEGITSRCEDMLHIICLDYDFIERNIVEDELRIIQEIFQTAPFYLFTTHEELSKVSKEPFGNYMAICLTKFPIGKVYEIISRTHCDVNYKKMWINSRYKAFVLRYTNKKDRPPPNYVGIVGEMKNLDNSVSEAHLKILKKLYNLDEIAYTNLDGLKKTKITSYKTNSHLEV